VVEWISETRILSNWSKIHRRNDVRETETAKAAAKILNMKSRE